MKSISYIFALTFAFMAMLIYVMVAGDGLGPELGKIMEAAKAPGVKMVLVDLYIGFLILAGWLIYRDGFGVKAIVIIAAMFILGNIIPLLYLLWLLIKTRGDVWEVLLGRNT